MQQYIYVLQVTRPAMLTEGPTQEEMKHVSDHFAYLQKLMEEGVMIVVGRTQTTHPQTMGIAIYNAESMEAAEGIKNADPVIIHGVMTATVYPYHLALIRESNYQPVAA